jgi:hypothetical protein
VNRAWTYQGIANSKIICFAAEAAAGDCVAGIRLCNALGDAIAHYSKTQQIDAYELLKQYPRLDALETLFDDWLWETMRSGLHSKLCVPWWAGLLLILTTISTLWSERSPRLHGRLPRICAKPTRVFHVGL